MVLNIAVIGAGIIGLTSACRILESIPNANITVFSAEFSPNTTSDVSAGYWEPYCLGDNNQDSLILYLFHIGNIFSLKISHLPLKLRKWGKYTYDRMLAASLSVDAHKCGVVTIPAYVIQKHEKPMVYSNME